MISFLKKVFFIIEGQRPKSEQIVTVDELIIYDDMQFTRRDWRNRNQIKTPQGVQWLTVPVKVKGKYYQSIREVKLDGMQWAKEQWKTLSQNFSKSSFFKEVTEFVESLNLDALLSKFFQVNYRFLKQFTITLTLR